MKYDLINIPNEKYNAKQQIFINRGIEEKDLVHYMNLNDNDINDPVIFGKELMDGAAECFLKALDADATICVVVDCDCDGYTSSAILINYIFDLKSKEWVDDHVFWYMHESKQHGLGDCMDWIEANNPGLVIIPDAGSNDIKQLDKLHKNGADIIILDHHELEVAPYEHCYLINSQSPEYPNKELSGAGVVYQFCKYVSRVKGLEDKHIEDWYFDLAAVGLVGDMMNLRSFETRQIIFKGLNPDNIHNPFVYEMWQKNKFKLTDHPTAWGITFYIVPLINAITRSGTLEEKELIFKSMLKFKAFDQIPSNKRGHKVGETERLVDQAIRTCTNVKNRQTRAEEAGLDLVKNLIVENNMLNHKVLLFQLEPGQIKPEIRGLVANKLMARYQRPCCMLTKRIERGINPTTGEVIEEHIKYEGSARGCDKSGVTEFKDICAGTGLCEYTVGHQGAFGLGLREENIKEFLSKTDEVLKDMSNEPIYYVDYIWSPSDIDAQSILDIAELNEYWGQGIWESQIAIRGLQITSSMITMMASNTMKITLPNNISIIKFRTPDEEFQKLYSENGYIEIDAICRCNINEWNGNRYAQLFLDDYNIVGGCAYVF